MITSLRLSGLAAFGSQAQEFGPLASVNFVYGPNGSGKTSISRQFDNIAQFPELASWVDSGRPAVHVFNRDYVKRTFAPERDLEGVFVLGEQSAGAQTDRERLQDERQTLRARIVKLRDVLGQPGGPRSPGQGKKGELALVKQALADAAWAEKRKFGTQFNDFFSGFNGSREVLLHEVLRIRSGRSAVDSDQSMASIDSNVAPATVTYDDLAARIGALNSDHLDDLRQIVLPTNFHGGVMPTSDLMAKAIMGRTDVSIAGLIESLGNSDWVAEGQTHLDHSEGLCPFCQQALPEGFRDRLVEYFDRGFEQDLAALTDYQARAEEFLAAAKGIATSLNSLPVDLAAPGAGENLTHDVDNLIREVRARLTAKNESPARAVEMVDTAQISISLIEAVAASNTLIRARLDLIANRQQEMLNLRAAVWDFLINSSLSAALDLYDAARNPLEKAIAALTTKVEESQQRLEQVEAEIGEISRSTISSAPVIDRINSMLKAVGFTSFKLSPSNVISDGYQLVRDSGEIVGHTLSEGERSFITFLYFANQIEGLQPEAGLSVDATVIIDDPISSLDSEALFFVSTYLRELLENVTAGATTVKQVVVLTHNVYFHKELTYNVEKLCGGNNVRYFGIAKRASSGNEIVQHETNPVSTAYAGLWRQVKEAHGGADVPGVQNAMRRIVESYFQFVGQPLLNDLPTSFTEVERMICRSLISWVHDGSHATSLLDAMDYSHSGASTQQWLVVFERLFTLTKHDNHFQTMMR